MGVIRCPSCFGSPSFHVGSCHCCAAHLLLLHLSPSVSLRLFLFRPPVQWFYHPPLSLSLSLSLLFSVFSLIHQLLTASLSLSPRVSICTFPGCSLCPIFSSFLLSFCRPFLCLSHSVSTRSERSSPMVKGVIGDKQFCLRCCSLSAPTGLSVYVCLCVRTVCTRVRETALSSTDRARLLCHDTLRHFIHLT